MKRDTKEALRKFAVMFADVGAKPVDSSDSLDTFLSPTKSISVDNAAYKALYRVLAEDPEMKQFEPLDEALGETNSFSNEELFTAFLAPGKRYMRDQLLGPQGIHQPIFAMASTALNFDVNNLPSYNNFRKRVAAAAGSMLVAANVDPSDPNSGEREAQEAYYETIKQSVIDESILSLYLGFKVVAHNEWLGEMRSLAVDKIMPDSTKAAISEMPLKSNTTYGYVGIVDPMASYCKDEANLADLATSLIPTVEWSRAQPYFNIRVLTDATRIVNDPNGNVGQLHAMSLDNFFRSGIRGGYAEGGSLDENLDIKPLLDNNGEQMVGEDGELFTVSGMTSVGMEVFTTPQAIIPAGQPNNAPFSTNLSADTYTSIDRMRPFMTAESLSVSTVPTAGASSTIRATLTLTLHDRGRLGQIADLIRPATLNRTEFDIEWGWSHPSGDIKGTNPENVYGLFINSLRQRQTFNLYASSYAFDETGQVQLQLQLVSKGVETLNETDAGWTGQVDESWRAVSAAFDAVKLAKQKMNADSNLASYVEGVPDVMNSAVLNTLSLDNTGTLISSKNRQAVEEWMAKTSKLTSGVPDLAGLLKSFQEMKSAVENANNTLQEDLNSKLNLLESIPYSSWSTYVKGADSEGKSDFLYNISNPQLSSGWEQNRKYVPLGAILQLFVVQPMMTNGMYDEVQLITYTANQHAGAAAGANLGAIPVDISPVGNTPFKKILAEQYKEYGAQFPVTRFIQWLVSNFVEPQFSACHGFGPGNSKFQYTEDGEVKVSEEATKNLVKEATANLRKMYYGDADPGGPYDPRPASFQPIKLKLLFEVAQSSDVELVRQGADPAVAEAFKDKTVLRIHVMDGTAEGAANEGWAQVLRQARSTKSGQLVVPADSKTPGMSDLVKTCVNWDQVRTTPRGAAKFLEEMGILQSRPVSSASNEEGNSIATRALTTEEKQQLENEEQAIKETIEVLDIRKISPARVKRLQDRLTVISKAIADDQMPFGLNSYHLVASPQLLIKVCATMAPNIVYGREGSLVRNLQVKQKSNSKASTIYMLRALDKPSGKSSSNNNRGLPMRLTPAEITVDAFGNPSFKYMQRFFIDADTGTTIDNLYAVTGLEHKITKEDFTTSLQMAPVEAYGIFQNLSTEIDTASDVVDALLAASRNRNIDIANTGRRAEIKRLSGITFPEAQAVERLGLEYKRLIENTIAYTTLAYQKAVQGFVRPREALNFELNVDTNSHHIGFYFTDKAGWVMQGVNGGMSRGVGSWGQMVSTNSTTGYYRYAPKSPDNIPGSVRAVAYLDTYFGAASASYLVQEIVWKPLRNLQIMNNANKTSEIVWNLILALVADKWYPTYTISDSTIRTGIIPFQSRNLNILNFPYWQPLADALFVNPAYTKGAPAGGAYKLSGAGFHAGSSGASFLQSGDTYPFTNGREGGWMDPAKPYEAPLNLGGPTALNNQSRFEIPTHTYYMDCPRFNYTLDFIGPPRVLPGGIGQLCLSAIEYFKEHSNSETDQAVSVLERKISKYDDFLAVGTYIEDYLKAQTQDKISELRAEIAATGR